ncbi:hypothetical protein L1987_33977 [Smallanthus sonchifolius]|uniref:Uncharacterized protein n=1 Tax=Smallanthus sonchifolius TaxID=185202 RepID=A0ACB9HS07_9ASTR|nr:hypothetical protein L1987_33977 [Smallanthus sonchifolius]
MGIDSSEKGNQIGLKERIKLVRKLYKQALKDSELRDEIFEQISKQTRNCLDRQHLIRAWELMYLYASCMPPSEDIGGYLPVYIHDVEHNVDTYPDVQVLAMKALNALKCSVKVGPRHTVLCREEIEALLIGKKLTIKVFLLDETYEEISYHMATTVSNVVEEYIGLDDNKYIGDLLAEFKSAKDRSKGEILQCKLFFKKKLLRESDEAITDPMFVQLSYVQLQHDYILGKDDAAQLSALQMLVEIGYVVKPEACIDWTLLLDQFLPRQIAKTRAKKDWDLDILDRYRSMVHFFRPVPKEHLLSAELRDITQFGSSNTAVFFKMKVAGVWHPFQFETKQGKEICVAHQTHNSEPPNVDVSEKRVRDLSKALEESQNTVKQLTTKLDGACSCAPQVMDGSDPDSTWILQRARVWSNGRLCNVKHRVKCKEANARVSIASFLLGQDEILEPLLELVDDDHPCVFVPTTYEDYRKLRYSTNLHAVIKLYQSESVGSPGVQIHTDSGFLTILQDDDGVGGLEVMNMSGEFIPVDPWPDTLIVNLGDMATVWSNGRLCNVKHRVQCKEANTRVSIASFLLGQDEILEPLLELVDDDHPCVFVPTTYEDYRKLRRGNLLQKDRTAFKSSSHLNPYRTHYTSDSLAI